MDNNDPHEKEVPLVVKKAIGFNQFVFQDGKIKLFDIPGTLCPNYSTIYLWRLLEKELGLEKASSILYNWGRFHANQTYNMLSKRFGYYEKLQDKKKLLEFNAGQTDLVGLGSWRWQVIDFDNKRFTIQGKSSFAEEYLRFFGRQNVPIDHWMRGNMEVYISNLLDGEECLSIETSCIAKGNPICEIMIRPIKDWDLNREDVKAQMITKNKATMAELDGYREPYMGLI